MSDSQSLQAKRPPIHQQVTFLYTAEQEATHDFYAGVLGLPLVLDQGACRIYGASETAFVGFCKQTANIDGVAAQGVILTLAVGTTELVDAWYAHLQTAGLNVIEKAPALNERFNIYHLFLRDPNGYLVEIQCFLDPNWPSASREETQAP